jgi:hypothetical protein
VVMGHGDPEYMLCIEPEQPELGRAEHENAKHKLWVGHRLTVERSTLSSHSSTATPSPSPLAFYCGYSTDVLPFTADTQRMS